VTDPLPVWTFTLWLKTHLSLSGLILAPRRRSSGARIVPKLSDYGVPVLGHVVAGW